MSIEVGELYKKPAPWRTWHDSVRDIGGRALYMLTELAQIKIEIDDEEGAILVPFPNYDQARSTIRNEVALKRFIGDELADFYNFVEFATN